MIDFVVNVKHNSYSSGGGTAVSDLYKNSLIRWG